MYLNLEEDIKSRLDWAKDYLKSCSIQTAELDAELILSRILGCERTELFAIGDFLDDSLASSFEYLVKLRGTRFPLQYITGSVNFMGLEFKIKPGVFIPRPETELLVEAVLNIQNAKHMTQGQLYILDLCTGCGNIAISLTKFSKIANIIASDVSDDTIGVAEENIKLHNCKNIKLVKSDLFKSIDSNKMDIIVSNPPYISKADSLELMPELLHEPESSLYGGLDGLQFYRRIFEEAPAFLKKDGYIIIEIGYNQASPIRKILNLQKLNLCRIIKDYNGIDRVMVVKRSDG